MALSEEAVVILKRRQTTAVTGNQYVFPSISQTGHLVEPKKDRQRVLNDDRIINKYRQCVSVIYSESTTIIDSVIFQ